MKLDFMYQDVSRCKEKLKNLGYKILEPINKYPIETADDLIYLFYGLLYKVNPEAKKLKRTKILDRKFVSSFIKNRMLKEDINKQRAIQECAELIIYLFKFISNDKLKLKYPIKSISILGSKKSQWLWDRVEFLITLTEYQRKLKKRQEFIDTFNELEKVEIQEQQIDREQFLNNLLVELTNGEKETREKGSFDTTRIS